jgi:hypothetical protein
MSRSAKWIFSFRFYEWKAFFHPFILRPITTSHPSWFHHSVFYGEDYKLWSSSMWNVISFSSKRRIAETVCVSIPWPLWFLNLCFHWCLSKSRTPLQLYSRYGISGTMSTVPLQWMNWDELNMIKFHYLYIAWQQGFQNIYTFVVYLPSLSDKVCLWNDHAIWPPLQASEQADYSSLNIVLTVCFEISYHH